MALFKHYNNAAGERGASVKTPYRFSLSMAGVQDVAVFRFSSLSSFLFPIATDPGRRLITPRCRHGGRFPRQKRPWLTGLLLRVWQFRNGRIHDSDNLALIIQADRDASSY